MKGTVAAFDELAGRSAAALVIDGKLDDLLVDPPDNCIRPGAVYLGRAGRPIKGLDAIFIDTPDGPLFLRKAKGVAPGSSVLVQTTSYAEPGKAAPATLKLNFKSRFSIITPGRPGANVSRSVADPEVRARLSDLGSLCIGDRPLGVVIRSAAAGADSELVAEEISRMAALASSIMNESDRTGTERLLDGPGAMDIALRDWPVPEVCDDRLGSFARHGVDLAADALSSPRTVIAADASFLVEPTTALVAVDVNTGSDTSPAAGLKANIATLRALPRALRLRGLGGQIVIDLAPCRKQNRTQIMQAAQKAFRADTIETTVIGWTPLGHLELMRKRERLPLSEAMR